MSQPQVDLDNDRLMTTEEVAKFFNVKPLTIRDWITNGKLKATKLNGYWRVWQSDVIKLAQERYGAYGS